MGGYTGLDPAGAVALARALDRAATALGPAIRAIEAERATGAEMGRVPPRDGVLAARDWAADAAVDLRRRIGDLDALDARHRRMIGSWLAGAVPHTPHRGALRALLDDPERRILAVDPAGDGTAVEVIGDLEIATHIVILVPGMGSGLDNEGARVTQARSLRAAAEAEDPHASVAVIVWLGYDAPDTPTFSDLGALLLGEDGVIDRAAADRGAAALAAFVPTLGHHGAPSDAAVTVIGHSYGSLVLGLALRRGLAVDHAVVIGSPGVGVPSVAALDLPHGTDFFAARIPFDPVSTLEWFGRDPTDPAFGAHAFATQAEAPWPMPANHGAYFTPGSESIRNLARIAVGRGNAVTRPASRGGDGVASGAAAAMLDAGLGAVIGGGGGAVIGGGGGAGANPIADPAREWVDETQESVDLGPADGIIDHTIDVVQWVDERVIDPGASVRDVAGAAIDWIFE